MAKMRFLVIFIVIFTYALFLNSTKVLAAISEYTIDLVKSVSISGENNWADEITILGPGTVDYLYQINVYGPVGINGELLTNISLYDDKLGLINSWLSLSPGDYVAFTVSADLSESTINWGTVYATDPTGINIMDFDSATVNIEPVPEPATMLLLGTGLVGVAGAARKRKKSQA
jgi:hypothetical protein